METFKRYLQELLLEFHSLPSMPMIAHIYFLLHIHSMLKDYKLLKTSSLDDKSKHYCDKSMKNIGIINKQFWFNHFKITIILRKRRYNWLLNEASKINKPTVD